MNLGGQLFRDGERRAERLVVGREGPGARRAPLAGRLEVLGPHHVEVAGRIERAIGSREDSGIGRLHQDLSAEKRAVRSETARPYVGRIAGRALAAGADDCQVPRGVHRDVPQPERAAQSERVRPGLSVGAVHAPLRWPVRPSHDEAAVGQRLDVVVLTAGADEERVPARMPRRVVEAAPEPVLRPDEDGSRGQTGDRPLHDRSEAVQVHLEVGGVHPDTVRVEAAGEEGVLRRVDDPSPRGDVAAARVGADGGVEDVGAGIDLRARVEERAVRRELGGQRMVGSAAPRVVLPPDEDHRAVGVGRHVDVLEEVGVVRGRRDGERRHDHDLCPGRDGREEPQERHQQTAGKTGHGRDIEGLALQVQEIAFYRTKFFLGS